ncbi:MAG: PKD domain-containing protein, partial [Gemmataceae bacterium]
MNSTAASAVVPATFLADGPGNVRVVGRMQNASGGTTDFATTIAVTNLAPTVSVTGPAATPAGTAIQFSATAGDPSPVDAQTLRYVWNFGDGNSWTFGNGSTGSALQPTHAYTAAGTYTATLTVTDKDGASVNQSVMVTVTLTVPPVPVSLQNSGFESPNIGPGAYLYNPTGTPWTFSGQSGVSGNGSGFTGSNPAAPEGTQVLFLQNTGSVSQSLALEAGSYSITFKAAQRVNLQSSAQILRVLVDSAVVGTFRPDGSAYGDYETAAFAVTTGNHTIRFEGLSPSSGDNTAFIDRVALVTPSASTPLSPPT